MSFLSGWTYRKKITIQGQSGAGSNYQVLLKIGETSGATGEDFDLENHSDIFPSDKNEGGDLRFTTDDGSTLLDFWVEKVEGTIPNRLAYIWVEVSADLGSNQDIYCYYGNAGASNDSDGETTFPFFDDFPGSSIDGSKWTETGTVVVSGSEAALNENDEIFGKTSFGIGYAYRAKSKSDEQDFNFLGAQSDFSNRILLYNADATYPDDFDRVTAFFHKAGVSGSTENDGWFNWLNTYYVYEIQRISSSLVKYSQGTNTNTYTNSAHIPTVDLFTRLNCYNNSQESTLTVDWSLVRKCIDTEPSFSSSSSEEALLSVELEDSIVISDSNNYPEFTAEDTLTLSDSLINDIAHYAIKIIQLDSNNLLIVTDTNLAKIIKVDISGATPVFRIYTLNNAKNAQDVTINSTFNKIYVACKEGKVAKLSSSDLTDKTILYTQVTDDFTGIDCFDEWYYTYAGSNDSNGEIILIDESEITKLNSDIRFLLQQEIKINSQINTINASAINSNFVFLKTENNIVNSDIRFSQYDYGEESIIARTDFHVYINGVETGDVTLDSIRVTKADETKNSASFSVARKHDDLDRTLEGVSSEITNHNAVIIKIKDITIFTGTIKEIQCYSTERIDITAESANFGEVDFSTVNLSLQSLNTQLSIYDVILNDINIFNPSIDENEENPLIYKGVSVDLGDSIIQTVIRTGELGRYPSISINTGEGNFHNHNLAIEVNQGTYKPNPNYTYFWWVSGWKKDTKGFWNLLNYSLRNNVFSVDYKNSWFYNNLAYYIGTSLSDVNSGIFHFDFVRAIKQQVFDPITVVLGDYTLGSAPYKTISARNGKKFYPPRYVDDSFFGLILDRPYGHNHIQYAKDVAAIEFDKMKTINDEILPVTRANINLTVDAYLYYNMKLNTRLNLDNTSLAGTYKNNNGFPVSVKGIEISSNSMQVKLICDNTKSKYELDALDDTMPDENDLKYYIPHLIVPIDRRFNLDTDEYETGSISIIIPSQNSEYAAYDVEGNNLVKYYF